MTKGKFSSFATQFLGLKKIGYPTAAPTTELANEFSTFFVEKVKLIREGLDSIETDTTASDYLSRYKPKKESSNLEILSEEQVRKLIINFSKNSI